MGEMALQGPHHVAQKSTATNLPELIYAVRLSESATYHSEQALRTICWNSLREVIGVTVISISVCWYRLIVGVGER